MTGGSPARRVAYEVVRRTFEQDAYADRAFAAAAAGLDPRERRQAMRLAFGAVQRMRTVDHAIEQLAGRRPQRLQAEGKVIASGSLSMPETWKTIQPVNRKPMVSDGPLSSEPQLAGAFFIIDAANIDEATAVASNHAAANYGEHVDMAVEVRECESYE